MVEDVALDRFRPEPDRDDEPSDPEILAMLRRAEEVQDAVRHRVTPDNWEAFRLIAIEGCPIVDTAAFLGREYTTVYRAYKRVSRMIADERRRDGVADEPSVRSG
jgi:DNA-directed RNA polymerase specialized sigma24 family protein